jgi:SAM-dependent methyltransferase
MEAVFFLVFVIHIQYRHIDLLDIPFVIYGATIEHRPDLHRRGPVDRALSNAERAAWTPYWHAGGNTAAIADLHFAALWHRHFASFPARSRLLDLGTGGGAVARQARDTGDALGRAFVVTGIDHADIAPVDIAAAARRTCTLSLRGGVAIEALPFADASFDGVCSQFGIEYAQCERAAAEVARVLKPGAAGLFVLHHTRSPITEHTARRLAAHLAAVADERPFALAREVFAGTAPADALRLCVARMEARLKPGAAFDNVRQTVEYLADLAATPAAFDAGDALQKIDAAEAVTISWVRRQQLQIAAALDDDGIAEWDSALALRGMIALQRKPIRGAAGRPLAWQLAFRKADQV